VKKSKAYAVGHGKPPKKHQFKKGQSGNPKGRPKGTKNLHTDVMEEMHESIVISEGGKTVAISKQRAMIKALVAKAIKGDVRAASKLVELWERADYSAKQSAQQQDAEELSAMDMEIFEAFKERIIKSTKTPSGGEQ